MQARNEKEKSREEIESGFRNEKSAFEKVTFFVVSDFHCERGGRVVNGVLLNYGKKLPSLFLSQPRLVRHRDRVSSWQGWTLGPK